MTSVFRHILDRWRLGLPAAVLIGTSPGALSGGLPGSLSGSPAFMALAQAPQAAPSASAPRPAGSPRFIVVLDAAHGGEDGGGQIAGSVLEKDVTLAFSVRLRSLLSARGFSVVTTREGNVNPDSDARAGIADHATLQASGAACLSLHASQAGSGIHIFVSSLAPAEPRRFLAWKTAQSAFVVRSLKLAGTINSAFEHNPPESLAAPGSDSAKANGPQIPATLGRASLPGLDSMTCPAVAIEIAPVRDADRKVVLEVTDPQYQSQVVETLAAALLEWKSEEESEPDSRGARARLP